MTEGPPSVGGRNWTAASPPAADPGAARWQDALAAARLFALDPAGMGGIAVSGGSGSVRERWLDELRRSLADGAPVRRLPAGIEDDRLLGGLDLTATLAAGRPVLQRGVLAEADGGVVVIPMAERLSAGVTARIAAALDRRELAIEREGMAARVGTRIGVIAFDDGASAEERVPAALLERLAFHIDLDEISARGLGRGSFEHREMVAQPAPLAAVEPASDDIVEALAATAAALDIGSVVAPLLALRAARASAALAGRAGITMDDAVLAARLVLAPRARAVPAADQTDTTDESADDDTPEPPAAGKEDPMPGETDDVERDPQTMPSLEDILLDAVRTTLPDGLLATPKAAGISRSPIRPRGGTGTTQLSLRRGRPAGIRSARPGPGSRLALVDTLRAAAPWQAMRRAETPQPSAIRRIEVRREDFRIRTFLQRRESTIVFCVDASGSSAFHRLAEAKGAVELLLAQAYIARTHAALIVFRGTGAEFLLPPTRSLSRAKSLLATLPGGGGTPLASGIDAAVLAALAERAKGREPLVVLLTDGRANIGRDGRAARPRAAEDALAAARQLVTARIAAVFIDTSPRPRTGASELAAAMGARYVALPFIAAAAVRDAVLAAAPALGAPALRPR